MANSCGGCRAAWCKGRAAAACTPAIVHAWRLHPDHRPRLASANPRAAQQCSVRLCHGTHAAPRRAARAAPQTESKPDKRLGALVNLYNVVEEPEAKLAVLLEALGFAQRAGLADLMLPVIRVRACV